MVSNSLRAYREDLDAEERQRARAPRACALLDEIQDVLCGQNQIAREELENLVIALGSMARSGEEVTEESELYVRERIKSIQASYCRSVS